MNLLKSFLYYFSGVTLLRICRLGEARFPSPHAREAGARRLLAFGAIVVTMTDSCQVGDWHSRDDYYGIAIIAILLRHYYCGIIVTLLPWMYWLYLLWHYCYGGINAALILWKYLLWHCYYSNIIAALLLWHCVFYIAYTRIYQYIPMLDLLTT